MIRRPADGTLTLIRHAPTVSNARGSFMGITDVPPSPEGLLRAAELGRTLEQSRFHIHFASPLSRALQTAQNIFQNAEISVDRNLIERNLGDWAGKTKDELRTLMPEAFNENGYVNPDFQPAGGEHIGSVVRRANAFLQRVHDLIRRNRDNHGETPMNVVAVTHNGMIRVFRSILESTPVNQIFKEAEPYLVPRVYYHAEDAWQSFRDVATEQSMAHQDFWWLTRGVFFEGRQT